MGWILAPCHRGVSPSRSLACCVTSGVSRQEEGLTDRQLSGPKCKEVSVKNSEPEGSGIQEFIRQREVLDPRTLASLSFELGVCSVPRLIWNEEGILQAPGHLKRVCSHRLHCHISYEAELPDNLFCTALRYLQVIPSKESDR